MVFNDSLEYTFTDVAQQGDCVLFNHHKQASKQTKSDVPSTFPLTLDVLHRTHGVPVLDSETKTASWQLEVPGMLMNHSCDPNVKAYPRCSDNAEDYAARDIRKGEELTVDYCLQYYDHGPFFEKCMCGATNCRGSMMGFVSLCDAEKERLFPLASDYVQARHLADSGRGLPVKPALTGSTLLRAPPIEPIVPRIVVPGPSHALADVFVQQDSKTGEFGLYSGKDIRSGSKFYEFWYQTWPDEISSVIDMVFAARLNAYDPPEGTMVRVDANNQALRDRSHHFMFSGWAMLMKHSCDPNLVYDNASKHEEEDWEWHSAYAAKDIKAGDQLTIDFNCMFWDRSSSVVKGGCDRGSVHCTGTMRGFRFLSREAQEARIHMTWRRVSAATNFLSESKSAPLGSALSPHVRENLRKQDVELVSDSEDSTCSVSVCSDDASSSDSND
jgi:hypothetical protein